MSQDRMLARRCAVQALYQWQLSRTDLSDIEQQFLEELHAAKSLFRRYKSGAELTLYEQELLEELLEKYCRAREATSPQPEPTSLRDLVDDCCAPEADSRYFKELLHSVPQKLDAIDEAVGEFADRPVAEIDPVERAILRISAYELLFRPDIPYRVVLNEGINLAKYFGATQSHRYVNGILDRLARKHRAPEAASASRH